MKQNVIINHLTNIGCIKGEQISKDVLRSLVVDRLYATNQYLTNIIEPYINNPRYLPYVQNNSHSCHNKSTIIINELTESLRELKVTNSLSSNSLL